MAKLTQDEIKWILSIDAKGVNKEIAVTSSEINKLSQANKVMAADMKAAEKQIKETEKAMEKLAKAGQQESEAYQELKATRDSARADIDDYTRKIGENNRAIDENKKKIEELTAGMDINEMSMKQLRQRASELKMQLNATSASANPKEFQALQKDLEKVNTRMFDVQNQGKGLVQQFASMNNPVGSAAKSVLGLGQALKALIANPVGIIIMAVAAAFMALKKAITSSEENMNKFQQLLAPLKVLFDALMLVIQKTAGVILDFVLKMLDGLAKLSEKLPFVGGKMKELNDKAKEGIELEKEKQVLRVRERESLISNAQKERDIAELRNKAKQRDKYTNKEIIGFLEEAIKKEDEIAKEKIEQARISLRILEAEAARAQNTEEVNRQIAEQTALLYNLETEFFKKTRRNESELYSRRDEMRREDEAKAKEAIEKKLENEEFALQKELTLIKKQLVEKEITQAEHDRLVEQKTLETLNKKLEIQGLEAKKRAEIEQQILDFKLMALEQDRQFEKEREAILAEYQKAVMTDNERELQTIRDKHDNRIKVLKEQFEKELITEAEFNEFRAIILEEQAKELEQKKNDQKEIEAAKQLAWQNEELEREKMIEMEKYATGLISKQNYEQAIINLEQEYALRSLEISNLSDEQKKAAKEKLLNFMIKKQEVETKKQEEEQNKRAALYSQFSTQIGETLGGFISGNEDMVKSGLKSIINMALDALKAQVQIAIVGVTAHGLMQSGLDPTAMARAAVKIALIEAAFAAVKGVVNSALSSENKSNSSQGSNETAGRGSYVVTGRQEGGFIDVSREQDKKRYLAKFIPNKRGYIDRPTVIVGDGPAGKSAEWVASNDALQNPTIAPFIRLLDEAQQAGNIRTIDLNHLMRSRMAGFESGGFIDRGITSDSSQRYSSSQQPFEAASITQEIQLMKEVRDLLTYLKDNGIIASVVLSDLQRQQDLLNKSQRIGTRS